MVNESVKFNSTPMEEFEEMLLHASRNGDHFTVEEILQAKVKGRITLNVNCKGRKKSNHGWASLHLASYFGHQSVVDLLLQNLADVNIQNDTGDTPLHKAAFTGRESIVIMLLQCNADVNIINGEGLTPRGLALSKDVRKLLEGAEQTEARKKEERLLRCAREGHMEAIATLFKGNSPPNVNCVDAAGNTALHCAAYRGQPEVAVLLLQHGIDTNICNKRGQRALDLAQTPKMKQVLDVQPMRTLQKHVSHFEGPLLKRSRFLGWKNIWVVLERGVLTYFASRADACCGVNRKSFKHLDGGKIIPLGVDNPVFLIRFSDNATHRLSLPDPEINPLSLQKWMNALHEHIAYSSHYVRKGTKFVDSDDDDDQTEVMRLGSLQDAFQTAQAYQQLLERQLCGVETTVVPDNSDTLKQGTALSVLQKLHEVADTSRNMITSLSHCLNIFTQQEEARLLQLKNEQEKCRVMEQALHVLAKEHHELEQSLSASTPPFHSPRSSFRSLRSPRFYDTSDDEFYDAYEGGGGGGGEGGSSDGTDWHSMCSSTTTLTDTRDRLSGSTGTLTSFKSNFSSSRRRMKPFGSLNDGAAERGRYMQYANSFGGGNSVICAQNSQLSTPSHVHTVRFPSGNRSAVRTYRTELPGTMVSRNDFSVWSILKHCIGKELSKITMPVVFNEPLSFLQRIAEYMEYSNLLVKANECQDPVTRMEYVGAFAVSALASNWDRLGKPFNPLLGETYELERDDFRLVSEQVCHHPPVSAFHVESKHFKFHCSIQPKLKFWGKSVEIQPKGVLTVELLGHGESYTWTNVNCCVHNIIVGKLWIEQYGVMELVNHSTGHKCVLNFKPAGWFSKDLHRIEGFIYDKQKKKVRYMYGKWTDLMKSVDVVSYDEYVKTHADKFKRQATMMDKSPQNTTPSGSPSSTPRKKPLSKLNSLSAALSFGGGSSAGNNVADEQSNNGVQDSAEEDTSDEPPKNDSTFSLDIPNSVLLWESDPRPDNSAQFYQFTLFAMALNEMDDDLRAKLAPTDSRLRPDIRKLEEGDLDGAALEKNRLEEKQRDARKSRKKDKSAHSPRWFQHATNPFTKEDDWLYTGGYWDRNFAHTPDIF